MRDLAELNVLIRRQADLPDGLKLVTDYFRDGWQRIRTGGSKGLEKKIKALNWHFIRDRYGITASGSGMTPQDAVVGALDHALAAVCPHWNAIEVAHIQSTQYPWFWLVRIRVETYRIQQGQSLAMLQVEMTSPRIEASPETETTDQADGDEIFANESSRMQEMATSSGVPQARRYR